MLCILKAEVFENISVGKLMDSFVVVFFLCCSAKLVRNLLLENKTGNNRFHCQNGFTHVLKGFLLRCDWDLGYVHALGNY